MSTGGCHSCESMCGLISVRHDSCLHYCDECAIINYGFLNCKENMMTDNFNQLEAVYAPVNGFYGKAWVYNGDGYKVLVSYGNALTAVNTDTENASFAFSVDTKDLTPTALRHVREFLKQNGFPRNKFMDSELKGMSANNECTVDRNDARLVAAQSAWDSEKPDRK